MAVKFATLINCMDGRVQEPALAYMRKKSGVDFVDSVTEAGPVKYLADPEADAAVYESIRKRVLISVEKHGSENIAVVAHYDCAGNPCGKEEQLRQLESALDNVRGWGLDAEVIGLWIGEEWKAEEFSEGG